MRTEHIPNKHLTYEGRNFAEIARGLNKDRTTIMREIQKRKFRKNPSGFNNYGNLCKSRYKCKRFDCNKRMEYYEKDICCKLTGAPYVCNRCEQKNKWKN